MKIGTMHLFEPGEFKEVICLLGNVDLFNARQRWVQNGIPDEFER